MKFISSMNPWYSVFFSNISSSEREEIAKWCRDNITGQLGITDVGGSSMTLKSYARPADELDNFGRKNFFAEKRDHATVIISFTEQSDLTAFLLVFESEAENTQNNQYR